MNWFNLPDKCVFNKEIPKKTLLDKIGNKNLRFRSSVATDIELCRIYACVNSFTYPTECSGEADSYYNEVIFFHVKLKNHTVSDSLTKNILRAFSYQTLIIYQYGNEFCLAVGLVRDAKKVSENRTVQQYAI